MNKRIMIVVPTLTSGGAERVASLWADFLADGLLYDVTLITYYKTENEYPLNKNVKRINLYTSKEEMHRRIIGSTFFRHIKRLKTVLKNEPQDLIIPFLTDLVCAIAGKFSKTIVTQNVRINPWKSPKTTIGRFIRDFFVKKQKSVIVQNQEQAIYFNHIKNLKCFIICNPVNPLIDNIFKKDYNNINKIVAVGRLCSQKNYIMMIDAIYILNSVFNKKIILDIYGIGEQEKYLKTYIIHKGLGDIITLKGRTNDVFNTIKNYDLYLMTSLYEGFPNALLEAMAIGLPSISTNCKTGPKDLINNGINGFLLNSFNSKDLANLINNIDDNKLLERIGQQARIDMKKFSREASMQQLNTCINELLGQKINE